MLGDIGSKTFNKSYKVFISRLPGSEKKIPNNEIYEIGHVMTCLSDM